MSYQTLIFGKGMTPFFSHIMEVWDKLFTGRVYVVAIHFFWSCTFLKDLHTERCACRV